MPLPGETVRPTQFIPFAGHFQPGGKSGNGVWVLAVFTAANVDTSFVIALGNAPDGYFVFQKSAPMDIYNGSNQTTDWTSNRIILRATAIGTARLWVS